MKKEEFKDGILLGGKQADGELPADGDQGRRPSSEDGPAKTADHP